VSVTIGSIPSLITRRRQNVGSTTGRGLELDAEYSPLPGVRVTAGYLFVDARISEFPASVELVGKRLPQVPRHNFTAQALYRFRDRWSVSSQLRAASSQFEDDRNTLRLRKYFTTDARVSYQLPYFIEVFLGVENLFDSRYDVALTPVRSVAAPRSARIGLRFTPVRR
jgi:outer membrane receptor protein involved in Fe transport